MRLSLYPHGNSLLALHSIQCILGWTSYTYTKWKWIIFFREIFYFPNICEDFVFSSVYWNLWGHSNIVVSVFTKQKLHYSWSTSACIVMVLAKRYINLLENCIWTLFVKQIGFIDGIAFLLMSKGCGMYSSINAMVATSVWIIITFFIVFFALINYNAVIFVVIIDLLLLLFYGKIFYYTISTIYNNCYSY